MADKKPSKKKRFQKILAVSSVIISLILSSMAYFNTSEIDEKSGEDGDYSITRMGPIYGTHSCEKGGFSIQIGIDSDHNQILDNDEVSEIRNVCHGNQGESGPMGNRGYWGYNGTDGLDGSNGTDGIDGNTKFAGAIVSTINLGQFENFLKNNDSFNFFKKFGGLIHTGPTHTNVNDIGIIIKQNL